MAQHPLFAKVHAILRSEIDAPLEHTATTPFCVREVPSSNRRSKVDARTASTAIEIEIEYAEIWFRRIERSEGDLTGGPVS
jgi:hypothetical protein